MRRIAAGMNHGAAMRHGKARLCRAECPPHFLFVLPKRKRAGHGTKEKTLRGDLTRRCQIIQNGGLAVTNCRPNPEVSYRLRYTYSAQNCVPAPESPPHTNVPNRTPPALLSAAAPPSNSGRGFQRRGPHLRPPSPGEGFQRERAAALALCVVGGPGRSRNALVLFFRGVGRVLFQKRMRPTSLRWEPPLAGVREMWGTFQWAKPIEKNRTAICSISASIHTTAPWPQWASGCPAGSGGWRPAPHPRSWRPARPDRSLSGRPHTVRRFHPPAPSG